MTISRDKWWELFATDETTADHGQLWPGQKGKNLALTPSVPWSHDPLLPYYLRCYLRCIDSALNSLSKQQENNWRFNSPNTFGNFAWKSILDLLRPISPAVMSVWFTLPSQFIYQRNERDHSALTLMIFQALKFYITIEVIFLNYFQTSFNPSSWIVKLYFC